MVNSSWTEGHINQLWAGVEDTKKDSEPTTARPVTVHKVYPPCDTSEFAKIPRKSEELFQKEGLIKVVSVGQFRPEKDHALQIRAMFELRQIVDEPVWSRVSGNGTSSHIQRGSLPI